MFLVDYADDSREVWLNFAWRFWIICGCVLYTVSTVVAAHGQTAHKQATIFSSDRTIQVRYPSLLLTCKHLDGENPDVWSPESCAAEVPVCDNSGHAGNVLLCLAYPTASWKGSELQAAAFSVSRIGNYASANECLQKWPRNNTSDIHSEEIGGNRFQVARATESGNSHIAEQHIYRIFRKSTCYELDVDLETALDTAFAAEDAPKKLSDEERKTILDSLMEALHGMRFLK